MVPYPHEENERLVENWCKNDCEIVPMGTDIESGKTSFELWIQKTTTKNDQKMEHSSKENRMNTGGKNTEHIIYVANWLDKRIWFKFNVMEDFSWLSAPTCGNTTATLFSIRLNSIQCAILPLNHQLAFGGAQNDSQQYFVCLTMANSTIFCLFSGNSK